MQTFLHDHLRVKRLRLIQPGQSVLAPPCGSPFTAVAHAVAIDVFYDTNADIIQATYLNSIAELIAANCTSIAAACLGCGYGRCAIDEFVKSIRGLVAHSFPLLNSVVFVTTNPDLADAIAAVAGIERCRK
jgi:O-acetyl-ADP-ribose deacetylase (regulator of RNase III)